MCEVYNAFDVMRGYDTHLEVFMVTPPNNTGAGLQLLWQVIHGNTLSLIETKHNAIFMPGHTHASL